MRSPPPPNTLLFSLIPNTKCGLWGIHLAGRLRAVAEHRGAGHEGLGCPAVVLGLSLGIEESGEARWGYHQPATRHKAPGAEGLGALAHVGPEPRRPAAVADAVPALERIPVPRPERHARAGREDDRTSHASAV